MRYRMQQKLFSLKDAFTIQTAGGADVYQVSGKLISIRDNLTLSDMQGHRLATIKQKLVRLRPTYHISRQGGVRAVVKKRLISLLRDRFTITVHGAPDLDVKGNIFDLDYRFLRGDEEVAHVSKKWFSIRDSYGVDVAPDQDDVLILACAIVIDMVSHAGKDE